MKKTRKVMAGAVQIGGGAPVTIQSMTNTDTADAIATADQILALEEAGCEIVRSSVYNETCAKAIPEIKSRIHIPLVADIHFDWRLAIAAMENGVDKLRFNPGNIGGEENVKRLVDCAKAHHVPMRIGVNGGSAEKELLRKYGGPKPEALVIWPHRTVTVSRFSRLFSPASVISPSPRPYFSNIVKSFCSIVYSIMAFASAISSSTAASRGTVLKSLPPLNRAQPPLPKATPISASAASPGPFTIQPITATLRYFPLGIRLESSCSTLLAALRRSVQVLPQVGQLTISTPSFLRPMAFSISFAA